MRVLEATLGGTPVRIAAPRPGEFDPGVFEASFPPGQLFGLDVETTFMDDAGQWSPDFKVRLVQIATPWWAWVLNVDDLDQRRAAVELLADHRNSFCSHTAMDVLSVAVALGVDISRRNTDTHLLAVMAAPDDRRGGADLKTLVTTHVGPELVGAERTLHAKFVDLWVGQGGKRNASKTTVDRHGWSAISVDDPDYLLYAGLDAIACRRLATHLTPATGAPPALLRVETWLAGAANRMQLRGLCVDLPELERLHTSATSETEAAEARIAEITQGVKARSPKLLDWLGAHGVDWSRWPGARTPGGVPSLAKRNVQLLLGYPLDAAATIVADELIRFRSHLDMQLRTTGIRSHIGTDGRLHPTLNTIATVTGRMSGTAPNLQNISKSDHRMRGLFLPDPGHVLITADFDQVELRVVAALARERKMIDTILAGGDLHQLTADEIGIDRATAKMTNFLIVYGGGGRALSEQANIPLDRARDIVNEFRGRYPAINDLSRRMGQFTDDMRSVSGRRIPVTRDRQGDLRSYANINYVVQSAARDLLVDAWHRFDYEFGRGDQVWLAIHDEIVLQVPEDDVEEARRVIAKCMSFDFLGVPISASAVALRDAHGTSRWMTASRAEELQNAMAVSM